MFKKFLILLPVFGLLFLINSAFAQDLVDNVVGTYYGDVISDAQGSSQSNVTLYVTRVDSRTVRVSSDYYRLGTYTVPLTRAGNAIVQSSGDVVFMLDLDKIPPQLNYNPGDVAYGGSKQ